MAVTITGSDAQVGYTQSEDLTNINFASAGPGGWYDAGGFDLPLPGKYLFTGSIREVITLATGSTGKQLIRLYDETLADAVSGSVIGNADAVETLAPTMDATVGYSFVYTVQQPTRITIQLGLANDPSTYSSAVTGTAAGGGSWMNVTLMQIVQNDA